MLISDFIKTLLKTKDPDEVSAELGISLSTVSKYKTGKMQPSKATAYRIYKKYGVTIVPYSEAGLKQYGKEVLGVSYDKTNQTDEG